MKRQLPLILTLSLLATSVAQAIGLGPIQRRSALNQPLEARIPLVGATVDELDTLRLNLAGSDQFDRAGIDRGALALQLRFELMQPESGADYIRVSTRDPVAEPFVSFLVELNWSAGRIFREYTILLDPPEFQRQPLAVNPAVTTNTQPRNRPASNTASPAPSAAPVERSAPVASLAGGERRVANGDTLWKIANEVAAGAGVSSTQALVAIWQGNPQAFAQGNMNVLKAGAILRIPEGSALTGMSNSEALALIRQQNAQWEAYRAGRASDTVALAPAEPEASAPAVADSTDTSSPEATTPGSTSSSADAAAEDPTLKLLPPASGSDQNDLSLAREEIASIKAENADLADRLAKDEELISRLERALEVKDAELARLQQSLGQPSESTPSEATATTPEPTASEPPPTETVAAEPPAAVAAADDPLAELPPVDGPEETEAEMAGPDAPGTATEVATDAGGEPAVPATEAPTAPEPVAETPTEEAPSETATTTGPEPDPASLPAESSPAEATDVASAAPPEPAPAPAESPITEAEAPPAPQDALMSLAEEIIPPAVAENVPGGALTVLGGGALAALGLLGWLLSKMTGKRSRGALTASQPVVVTDSDDAPTTFDPGSTVEAPQPQLAASPPAMAPSDDSEFTRTQTNLAATVGLNAPVTAEPEQLPEEDLTEVNVYLAYEQYTQAESLVRKAMQQRPSDARLHLRLLEVFYASGDAAAFERAARDLQALTQSTGPHWDDALKLWQELAPGRTLFGGEDATVDRSQQENSASRAFVDITGDARSTPPSAGALDLDLGDATLASAPGESTADDRFDPTSLDALATPDFDLSFDAAGGTDATPTDIPEGDSNDALLDLTLVEPDAPDTQLVGSASDMDLLDITGGDSFGETTAMGSADLDGIIDISSDSTGLAALEMGDNDAGATFDLDPSADLLDLTTSGTPGSNELRDMLDVSLEAGGLGDLLDVSKSSRTSGELGAGLAGLDAAAPVADAPLADPLGLDVPLEFNLGEIETTDLRDQDPPSAAPLEFDPTDSMGLPSIGSLELVMLDDEQSTVETFDAPRSPLDLGGADIDETQSVDDLAQALEDTANRMSEQAAVPSLSEFGGEEGSEELVFDASDDDVGIDFDLDTGESNDQVAEDLQTLVLPRGGSVGQAVEDNDDAFVLDITGGDFSNDQLQESDPTGIAEQSRQDAPPEPQMDSDFILDVTSGELSDTSASEPTDTMPTEIMSATGLELSFDLEPPVASGDEPPVGEVSAGAGFGLPELSLEDTSYLSATSTESELDDISGADGRLNLAHAYIEIGDRDSARTELEFVLNQGTPEQQESARRLLAQLDS